MYCEIETIDVQMLINNHNTRYNVPEPDQSRADDGMAISSVPQDARNISQILVLAI